MFDVGFWELFVIGLIALIVFGPERLPGLARTVGLWIGRARAAFYSVREEMEREINADRLRETQRALQREMAERTRSVAQATRTTDAAAEQQTPPSQSPAEETTAADQQTREGTRAAYSPRADEPSPPNSMNSPTTDHGKADCTGRNTRQ